MSSRNYGFPITLALMCKNEAHILERCLDSVKEHITGWVIVDTGSTDGTQDLIREELADIPGVLLEEPFVNFAVNRTSLINHARQFVQSPIRRGLNSGYLLLLDADHVLHGDFSGVGDADGYLIELPGHPIAYKMPYLVGADIPWRYVSPTHEYLTADVPFEYENLDSCTIEHFGDGGTRPEKFERDLRLLEEAYAEDPNNERTVYYLAQTNEGLGNTERAIELFKRRTELGGWDQEIFWAYFKIAELTGRVEDYLTAWLYRTSRWEPIQRAMKILNEQQNYHAVLALAKAATQAPSTDHFFVERWVEEYGLAFEYCLALWWTGNIPAAKEGWEAMLQLPNITDGYRESCINNLTHC